MGRGTRRGKGRKATKVKPSHAPNSRPVEPRPEAEVFEDLRKLAQSPGFIHALAALTFKSHVVSAGDEFTVEDFRRIYQPDKLIRTETNLLTGLMLSADVDMMLPDQHTTQQYIDDSIALLEELHEAIKAPGYQLFLTALKDHSEGKETVVSPLTSGVILREAIFYGGESAFTFQYLALARERYAADREWLQTHKGFNIQEASEVLSIIRKTIEANFPLHLEVLRGQSPEEWSWLPLFTFTFDDILAQTSLNDGTVRAVVDAFSVHEKNDELRLAYAGDYNKAATQPLIRLRNGTMLSLLEYGAYAALYENPFYWIAQDAKYLGKHSQTRGSFVEAFTERTLCKVFPERFVHRNVVFKSRSGDTIGEADAILLYGYRAFIVQAKSKRLTLPSWQGDDLSIARDFGAAVQQAYDQAIHCIRHIKNDELAYATGEQIDLLKYGEIREFYPICITSEHYPALAFQSGLFLQLQTESQILHPIVTDLFTLDVIAEMLPTPMYFTDYLVKRAAAAEKLLVTHELVALAWYIKKNLHIEENQFFSLADDIMIELDLAMAVRKTGIAGRATPEGQLTRFAGTPAGKILDHVNLSDRPDVHRLGELILGMGSDAAEILDKGIKRVLAASKRDGKKHDVTMGLEGGGGITIHCNPEVVEKAVRLLTSHAAMRKYVEKADRWYGVLIDAKGEPEFLTGLEFPWVFDAKIEVEARPFRVSSVTHSMVGKRKIGRNELCPCESGKKYKNCCLHAELL